MRSLPLVGPIAIVVTACSGGRSGTPGDVTVVDSAGVTIVTDAGAGIERPLDVALAPEPHLRIGSIQGGEETQLTRVGSVQRLSDGRILVAEVGALRVRIFDGDGGFLRWIGRVGDGPGEYAYVGGAGLLDGDTVWVADTRRRELELFGPDGSFVRTLRPDRPVDVPFLRGYVMLSDGTVLAVGSTFDPAGGLPDGTGSFQEEVVMSALSPEGRDAVAVARGPGIIYEYTSAGGRVMSFTSMADLHFASRPLFAAAPGSVLRLDPGTFEIEAYSLDGTLRSILRVRASRRPVTPAMIDAYEQDFLDQVSGDRVGLEATRRSMLQWTYADSLPHFGTPVLDDQQAMWLPEYRVAGTSVDRYRVWKLGVDAGAVGYLTVPRALHILSIQGDEVLGYVTDDYDVPYVVAYRLVPAS